MSGYVDDDVFYFTYAWGSGMIRSHLGAIRIVDCDIQSIDSGGIIDPLLVTKSGDDVVLEVGQLESFNNWSESQYFGEVVLTDDHLEIIDESAETIEPDFPSNGSVESCF